MVWFFSGGLQMGYAGLPLYDGTNIVAQQDLILVASNYRTNGRTTVT
jgi:carboxylesterase type B